MNPRHKGSQLQLIVLPPIDETSIIHRKESNQQSQEILDANRSHLTRQAKIIFRMLMTGMELTAISAAAGIRFEGEWHIIGDIRTRMSEFRNHKPSAIAFHNQIYTGRFKKFYMTQEDKEANRINFPYYLKKSTL
jgi:hypothetical protein